MASFNAKFALPRNIAENNDRGEVIDRWKIILQVKQQGLKSKVTTNQKSERSLNYALAFALQLWKSTENSDFVAE
jgi:50S ribosomal subunit-associated GTPase HflX